MAYKIVASQCSVCGACEFECPNGAISLKRDTYVIDPKSAQSARGAAIRRNAPSSVQSRAHASPPDDVEENAAPIESIERSSAHAHRIVKRRGELAVDCRSVASSPAINR